MKSQSILRQSGGADTKLRTKSKKRLLFVCLGVGFLVCVLLFWVADNVFNGFFREWFTDIFTISEWMIDKQGNSIYVHNLMWYKLRTPIFLIVFVNVVVWPVGIVFASHFYAQKKVRSSISWTSDMIQRYMQNDLEISQVFPKEYSEVSAQMAQLKSDMQRNEQILREEASRKNDLITYLAHDLKTPLTSIIGYLSLLDELPEMPMEQKAKYVGITLDKAKRLEKLINEFFEITRYNLQQIVLEKETVDLYCMLVQMTDEFYPILEAHGNHIMLEADEDMIVYADVMRLARVFNNILKNAISYSYPATEIKVRAVKRKGSVSISFENKGKTIPKHKLEAIFEKFFRLDDARASNTGGAGLGLAIAKEIVTLHGGEITAESEDGCTVFKVNLPVLQV